MKIAAISDLHGQLPIVPECDLLLIAGDVCPVWNHTLFYQQQWLDTNFRTWLGNIKADKIVGIAGNHDWIFQKDPDRVPELPWTYLRDEAYVHQGFKIYGTPWQPTFLNWAFNLDEHELVEKWAMIPDDTDILVVHGPPKNFGDDVFNRGFPENVGSPSLAERIFQIKPKIVVFGHVHGGYGQWEEEGIQLANVSLLDESYNMTNQPVVFELKD